MKKLAVAALLLATAACSTNPAPGVSPTSDLVVQKKLLTLDTHLDTPIHFSRQGWSFGDRHDIATDLVQVDLGRMDAGDLDGGFFVIYTAQGPLTPEGYAQAKASAFKRLGEIESTVAKFHNRIEFATTAADAARIDKEGKRFAYISIENSYPLGEDLSLLGEFYKRGVRLAGPVHFKNNEFADSATDTPKWHGLSPLGKQWVQEMNRLGMVLDASHASDDVFDQMVALSKTPILLSHSGSRAMWNHPRNIDDARLKKLAASGGAICVNTAYLSEMKSSPERDALSEKWENIGALSPAEQADVTKKMRALDVTQPVQSADFDTYMRTVLHIIDVAGVDHVCFGADWDGGGGVKGLEDIDQLPKVTARLREAGYSMADIQKMWSGNVLRILKAAEDAKGK